jgi:hypothetical protein
MTTFNATLKDHLDNIPADEYAISIENLILTFMDYVDDLRTIYKTEQKCKLLELLIEVAGLCQRTSETYQLTQQPLMPQIENIDQLNAFLDLLKKTVNFSNGVCSLQAGVIDGYNLTISTNLKETIDNLKLPLKVS